MILGHHLTLYAVGGLQYRIDSLGIKMWSRKREELNKRVELWDKNRTQMVLISMSSHCKVGSSSTQAEINTELKVIP